MTITLNPLEPDDREQFVLDNQEAFNYGALEEFGRRDDHFEEEGQIISRKTIEESIDSGEAYRIVSGDQNLGGVVIKLDGDHGDLDLMFVSPKVKIGPSSLIPSATTNLKCPSRSWVMPRKVIASFTGG